MACWIKFQILNNFRQNWQLLIQNPNCVTVISSHQSSILPLSYMHSTFFMHFTVECRMAYSTRRMPAMENTVNNFNILEKNQKIVQKKLYRNFKMQGNRQNHLITHIFQNQDSNTYTYRIILLYWGKKQYLRKMFF